MTSLHDAIGKPAILRETAEQLGSASFFAVDAADRRVTVLALGSGRSTRLVDWSDIQSIGPDAIIVNTSREATAEDDRAVSGAANPLGKRALSDLGNELGSVNDVEVDDDGVVQSIAIADARVEGVRLEGVGSYAVVVAADPSEA
jgi:uncharacterized protein YrrD